MKKIVTLSILAAVSIALTAGVALANYGNDNKLSGYVKVKGTLVPINKARVNIYTTNGSKRDSDKTNKKGKYSFDDLKERKYVVRTTAVGYHDPKNVTRNRISSTVKVDGSDHKNFYFVK
ncbi:MAG: carboxypeptidase regulatory-like domain-containing protein [Parcubacteria group bacterium]